MSEPMQPQKVCPLCFGRGIYPGPPAALSIPWKAYACTWCGGNGWVDNHAYWDQFRGKEEKT
jgi:hypothetical protein